MNKIRFLSIHHSGGIGTDNYASTAHLTAGRIDYAHRIKWNFESKLGHFGGYNFIIERNGSWVQHRAIGEATAAQRGHNFDTISICLIGNFNKLNGLFIDNPMVEQIATLKYLLSAFMENRPEMYEKIGIKIAPDTKIKIPAYNIVPHRYFRPTQCYGDGLSDSWARSLIMDLVYRQHANYKRIIEVYARILMLLTKTRRMGSLSAECEGERD